MNPKNNILLIDLCSRLPYGVKVLNSTFATPNVQTLLGRMSEDTFIMSETYKEVGGDDFRMVRDGVNYTGHIEDIKPYLRSLKSMTEEEKETYYNLCYEEEREEFEFGEWSARIHYHDTIDSIDYLNSIHIDYRGLIEKELAIKVTDENNHISNKL